MSEEELKGKVVTVSGPVDSNKLGVTLPHEHFFYDSRSRFVEPEDDSGKEYAHQSVTLENVGWITRNWINNVDNLVVDDEAVAITEAQLFKDVGGGTIVDVTNVGQPRNPEALCRIAQATGLDIVMGSGYYFGYFHPGDMDSRTEDDITKEIISDLTVGVDGTGIKAGLIGEVGFSTPFDPNEIKSLRASVAAQKECGVALSIHPGPGADSPFQIIDMLEKAGADLSRVVMGHIERSSLDMDGILKVASRGCYVEFDWFGTLNPAYPYGPVDVPSDSVRIKQIRKLIAEGHLDQVLVSHDVCFKMRMACYGGPGYAHISKYVVQWMDEMGITPDEIESLTKANPQRMLAVI